MALRCLFLRPDSYLLRSLTLFWVSANGVCIQTNKESAPAARATFLNSARDFLKLALKSQMTEAPVFSNSARMYCITRRICLCSSLLCCGFSKIILRSLEARMCNKFRSLAQRSEKYVLPEPGK